MCFPGSSSVLHDFYTPFHLPDADYNANNDTGDDDDDDDDDDDGTLGEGRSQEWVEPGPLSHSREEKPLTEQACPTWIIRRLKKKTLLWHFRHYIHGRGLDR